MGFALKMGSENGFQKRFLEGFSEGAQNSPSESTRRTLHKSPHPRKEAGRTRFGLCRTFHTAFLTLLNFSPGLAP